MANVNQINESAQPITGTGKVRPKSGGKSEAFGNLLSSALDQKTEVQSKEGPPPLQEIQSPGLDIKTPSSIVTGKTDQLLGLLDQYADSLGNPGVSLKHIAPVIEQMNAEADALMKQARFLGNHEGGLKEIATRTAVTAQTEYVKFQRGDYLS